MFHHVPVMRAEAVDALCVREGGLYVDGTLGGGGHSEAILSLGGRVVGIDRDSEAIGAATQRLSGYASFRALHGNFHEMKALLSSLGETAADGVLLDLGVSSHQLDRGERGFSYHADAPLDMRMDREQRLTAQTIANEWEEADIARILLEYGEEKWAARIAKIIVEHRAQRPLLTTGDLVRAVDAAIPRRVRDKAAGHSAQRTFQALRIAVNDELEPLGRALSDALSLLVSGGRLCVITFHSLEDRIVKRALRRMENPCECPPGLPVCVCGKRPTARLPVRGAIKPSGAELSENPRARSAKLRVAERI